MRISRRWRAVIGPVASAVVVALTASLLVAPAASAESAPAESPPSVAAARTAAPSTSYLCTGYAACRRAGYPHAGYATAGKEMWWRMYAGHNCTNYVAYRMVQGGMSAQRPWSGEGNAWNWGYVKASITDQVPMVGSVAWWDRNVPGAGSSGHVAYVERVISDTEIIISEDSWGGDFSWRRLVKGRGWPTGFIHFNDVKVANVAAPRVAGAPAVGATLAAQPGTWAPAGSYKYRWFVDGNRLMKQNGATFAPRPAHLDKEIAVRIIGTSTGYLNGVADSARTTPVEPGTLAPGAAPAIEGVAEVDRELSVSLGSVSPAAGTTRVRWLADGTPVPGATGTVLTLDQAQIGKRITAEITYGRKGYHDRIAPSPATAAVLAGTIQASGFRVVGEARRGQVLTVEPGTVEPADADVRLQWLRNGVPTGVTGSAYELGPEDVGARIRPRISITRTHYRSYERTMKRSARVVTDPRLGVRAIGRPERAVVRLRVVAPGVADPQGTAVVRVGQQRVEVPLSQGRARVVVRGLTPGKRVVRVAYAGTHLITPVRSPRGHVVVARPR
ncbi:MAG: CHAP domain-containing protein [Nocardioides sp.]|nr:CHAP domain-containing protein [Nocardioides sp.]